MRDSAPWRYLNKAYTYCTQILFIQFQFITFTVNINVYFNLMTQHLQQQYTCYQYLAHSHLLQSLSQSMLFQVYRYLRPSKFKVLFIVYFKTILIMHQHTLLPEYSLICNKKIWHLKVKLQQAGYKHESPKWD
jgi:hypothetical protein